MGNVLIKKDWPVTGLGKIFTLIDWFWSRNLGKTAGKMGAEIARKTCVMKVARGLQRPCHHLRPMRRNGELRSERGCYVCPMAAHG